MTIHTFGRDGLFDNFDLHSKDDSSTDQPQKDFLWSGTSADTQAGGVWNSFSVQDAGASPGAPSLSFLNSASLMPHAFVVPAQPSVTPTQPRPELYKAPVFHPSAAHDVPVSPSMSSEVSFISGINSAGQNVTPDFWSWMGDNPAHFDTNSSAHKWGAPTPATTGGTISFYFDPGSNWTATEEAALTSGLTLWSDEVNIHFALTTDATAAQLTFVRGGDGSAFETGPWSGDASAGTAGNSDLFTMTSAQISIDTSVPGFGPIDGSFSEFGGYVWDTLVHEEGHAIGLGHAGPYNGDVDATTQQYSAYDTRQWSIMSYIMPTDPSKYEASYPTPGTDWGSAPDGYFNVPTTPMMLDILAAQGLYGAATTGALTGGQVFGFDCNITDSSKQFFDFTNDVNPVVTLYDSGTHNTLDLTGYATDSSVDLVPGTFSSCNGEVNNIGIAFNTAIDTLLLGSGTNTVIGNNDGDTITGGAGNDTITGGSSGDSINITKGGADTVSAGGGNDLIYAGAALTAADKIDGGAGTDIAYLDGNYTGASALVFNATTMVNVERLILSAGFNYSLTTNDATVAAGQTLLVNASALGASNTFTFNGAAEHDGAFNITGGAGGNNITGGAGNDTLTGGASADAIHIESGGNDIVSAGDGNDLIYTGAALTAADKIDGGAGTDIAYLSGNYTGASALVFNATTMVNVERLILSAGFNYSLTTNDATVAAGQTLLVNASALGASNTFTFNGAAEHDGAFNITGGAGGNNITGGAGNDTLTGGASADAIHIESGGNDIVSAGDGNDLIYAGAALTAADKIDGGAGTDIAYLDGNYTGASALVFNATTMVNVERLILSAGFNYSLTTNDATVAAGQTLLVNASALGASNTFTFNGAAEHDGAFNITGGAGGNNITGGAGNDTLTGGASADAIHIESGGNDIVSAGDGNDLIYTGAALTAADKIDGGAGTDIAYLSGNYTGASALVFNATTMVNVERLILSAGFNYSLTTNDATVAAGQTLLVNASALGASNTFTFNGAAEHDGAFNITGGAGADNLTGGALADTFVYTSAAQSTSTTYDTINSFNFAADRFDIPGGAGTITSIDTALTSGNLSTATFNTDLTSDLTGHLGAHHAMLFTASGGTLSGQTFLVVDLNGTAGYQAGADLVIHMTGSTGALATGDFI